MRGGDGHVGEFSEEEPLLVLLQPRLLLSAQPTPTPAEVVSLSPFEVNSSKDVGYLAKDTLAGSRLNTKLRDPKSLVQKWTDEKLSELAESVINVEAAEAPDAGR